MYYVQGRSKVFDREVTDGTVQEPFKLVDFQLVSKRLRLVFTSIS